MESELVSGFMTEHAAVIFVFFFLGEYSSILLMCVLISILFLGGYLFNIMPLVNLIKYIDLDLYIVIVYILKKIISYPIIIGALYGITLGVKTFILIFFFI